MSGFRHLGASEGDPQYHLYRADEGIPQKRPGRHQHREQTPDWTALAETFAKNLSREVQDELAAALKLPVEALDVLPLVGFNPADRAGACWTFPECGVAGRVVGINRRFKDGTKKVMAGGRRGLTVPASWRDRLGPVLLVEGASDTLAVSLCGLAVVGRPSSTGGVEHLAELLKGVPADRTVLVVGENDLKASGQWPGKRGAEQTAAALSGRLGRPVEVAFPPDGVKDVRDWIIHAAAGAGDPADWQAIGRQLLTRLEITGSMSRPAPVTIPAPISPDRFTPFPVDALPPRLKALVLALQR